MRQYKIVLPTGKLHFLYLSFKVKRCVKSKQVGQNLSKTLFKKWSYFLGASPPPPPMYIITGLALAAVTNFTTQGGRTFPHHCKRPYIIDLKEPFTLPLE